MNKPVSEHVALIKSAIARFEQELAALNDPIETMKLEADMKSLRLALMHYELALQIEREVIESRKERGVVSHIA